MALLETMQRALATCESDATQTVLYRPDIETRQFLARNQAVAMAAQDAIHAIRARFEGASIHVSVMCDPDTSDEMLAVEIVSKQGPDENRQQLRDLMRTLPDSVAAIEDSFLFSVVRG